MGKQSMKRRGNSELWTAVGGHLNRSPVLDTAMTLNKTEVKQLFIKGYKCTQAVRTWPCCKNVSGDFLWGCAEPADGSLSSEDSIVSSNNKTSGPLSF